MVFILSIIYYLFIYFLLCQKEYETSIKYHELALKTASDDCGKAIAKYDMSQCYFKLREDEKAFALLNEAKETADNNYCNYLYYEIKGQFLADLV